MNFSLLESFIEVTKTNSFSKAAVNLYIPQPTLSNRIRQLEETLGSSLFIRNKNKIELTKAGEIFLPYAKELIDLLDKAKAQIETYTQGVLSKVNIALPKGFLYNELISELMPQLIKDYPDNVFTISSFDVNEIPTLIDNNSIQLGIVPYFIPIKGLEFKKVTEHDIVVVVSPDHSYFKNSIPELSLEMVSCEPIVTLSRKSLFKEITLSATMVEHNVKPNIIASVDDLDALKLMIKKNLGIALLPEHFVRKEVSQHSLVTIPIRNNPFKKYTTYIVHKKDFNGNKLLHSITIKVHHVINNTL